MAEQSFDVVIIGSGPGGYIAAVRASQLGLKTAIVERDKLGGICLNWGCIPTKALLRSAEVYMLMEKAEEFGLSAEKIGFDGKKIVERSRKVADKLSNGIQFLMKKNKVSVIDGTAKLAGKGLVEVEKDGKTEKIKAKNIILATGARARELKGMEADGELIWTYKHAMTPKEMPKSLLVIGSGAIGMEFASFYRSFGADVTVVEVLDRILPVEDEEISKQAERAFKKRGIKIITGGQVQKLDKGKNNVTAHVKTKKGTEEITVDRVMVDKWCETAAQGIYAIGDLVGAPWLAHKASHEGVLAAERIAGVKDAHPLDVTKVPGCTYSHPQVASVGLTEAKAKEAGYKVKVGRAPFQANGKAIALGETDGFIKTVFDEKTGELLGAHMIGPEVTELIQGYVVARQLETTEADLMAAIFPHPTLSEHMHESVLDAFGRPLNF